jgi:hypothetical protein
VDLTRRSPDRTIRVFPDPSDDECFVDMRELSDAEINRIFDEEGYVPGHPKRGGMQRLAKCRAREILRTVTAIQGVQLDGRPVAVEDSKSVLAVMLETVVDVDGDETSLWQHLLNLRAEARKSTEKNAWTPSAGNSDGVTT